VVEGRGKRTELEELASLVVILSVRIERLFELCDANHVALDELRVKVESLRRGLEEIYRADIVES